MKKIGIEKIKTNGDHHNQSEEICLKLECCNIEVGGWYQYCPKCGKKIEVEKCEKKKVLQGTGIYDLFDYAIWSCSCGKGYERYEYSYCPICGKERVEINSDVVLKRFCE